MQGVGSIHRHWQAIAGFTTCLSSTGPSVAPYLLGIAFALVGVQPARGEADEFAGTNLLAGALFLETGAGSALVRSNVAWSAPAQLTHPALVFAVGFTTQEAIVPGEFFDSLTVTVRDSSNTFVAAVLTLDALGATVMPETPGSAKLPATAVESEALTFPPMPGVFSSRQALLLMVVLPTGLAGQSGTLRLSLFDNNDSDASAGFISHLTVVPGPGTALALESSAVVSGPYAIEEGSVRHARRRITIPRTGTRRFFVLDAVSSTQITAFGPVGGDWLFRYTSGAGVVPRLLSSSQAAGPYAPESGIVTDTLNRTLRLPGSGVMRFFRLKAEIPLVIRSLAIEGDNLAIHYE